MKLDFFQAVHVANISCALWKVKRATCIESQLNHLPPLTSPPYAYLYQVWDRVHALEAAARSELIEQGFKPEDVFCQAYLNLRFQGTDTALMTLATAPVPPTAHAPEPGSSIEEGAGSDGMGDRDNIGGGGSDVTALDSFFAQYR